MVKPQRKGAGKSREKIESLGDAMRAFFAAYPPAPKNFMKHRKDAPPQVRKSIFLPLQ